MEKRIETEKWAMRFCAINVTVHEEVGDSGQKRSFDLLEETPISIEKLWGKTNGERKGRQFEKTKQVGQAVRLEEIVEPFWAKRTNCDSSDYDWSKNPFWSSLEASEERSGRNSRDNQKLSRVSRKSVAKKDVSKWSKLVELPGIGKHSAEKLESRGIETAHELVKIIRGISSSESVLWLTQEVGLRRREAVKCSKAIRAFVSNQT